jgi:hypothetical protein
VTELTKVPVRSAAEIEPALATIARQGGNGLMCLPDPFTNAHRDLIVRLAGRDLDRADRKAVARYAGLTGAPVRWWSNGLTHGVV